MIEFSYSYSNGDKHTFVYENPLDLYDKFAKLVNECFDNNIQITIKIKLK